jgi:ATP-binding cassette subfamily B multidrug efflux pump
LTEPFLKALRHFRTLKPYFVQNRLALAVGLLCLLLVDGLQLLIPQVIKRAIDGLTIERGTPRLLLTCALVIIGIALLMGLFRYVWRYLIFGHSRRIERDLRNRMYRHLQTLSPDFFQKAKTGDIMARAVNDINAIRMAAGMGLVALTDGTVLGVAAIGFMISIDLKLTLISLIPAPIVVMLTRSLTRRMSQAFETVQQTFSDLTEKVRETFAGIRVIKAYHRETWTGERLEQEGSRYVAENMRLARVQGLFFPMMAIFANAGLAVVIGLGGRLTILGEISTGDFVAFTAYLNLLAWPMMAMGWVTNLVQRGAVSMRRINQILDETPEIGDTPDARTLDRVEGAISFRGFTFGYATNPEPVLKDLRIRIDPGQSVAIVGRVGSGKSTLLKALPRMIKVPPGSIYLDGVDILLLPLDTLRRSMAFVTQDVFVFSDTIRNNIVFGRDGFTEEWLHTVVRASGLEEEIRRFEKGLNTMIGERGIALSGGQRQRLTIARALMATPPILIMDDPLSMVDTLTEDRILTRVLALRRNKTTILVSHRVKTLSRVDRVFVLDGGRVVEEGNHNDLIRAGGLYEALYERQLLADELETGDF